MSEKKFKICTNKTPKGDQPAAIKKLVEGIRGGKHDQVLLGATGTGKGFTIANVIEQVQKPTLVIVHNKTLAAQLCTEFREIFPDNAVNYFVSYYDFYQPEAYIAHSDTYIEKDAQINQEIDKYRHAATMNLLTRRDVIVVASVSCIYGLGSPEEYLKLRINLKVGDQVKRDLLLRKFADLQYQRAQLEFRQGMFHVLGDTVEVYPPEETRQFAWNFR